jgi:hypothetical protein
MAYVTIDPDFEALIPKLRPEEFEQLERNIRRDGCRDMLRTWNGVLIDGHNRYHICKKHGIGFGQTEVELQDRDAALLWIEQNQLGRRNLTDDQRAIIAGRAANRQAEASRKAAQKAATDAAAAKKTCKPSVEDTASPTEDKPKQRARERAAKEAQVPERKVRAAQKLEKDAPDMATKVLNGEMPLARAVREVKAHEPEAEPSKPFCQGHPSYKQSQRAYSTRMIGILEDLGFNAGLLGEIGLQRAFTLSPEFAKSSLDGLLSLRASLDVLIPKLETMS